MTHTLHRRGSLDELQKDYVILAMAARGVNREGAAPALARALEIFAAHNPVNFGNVAGNAFTGELAQIAAKTKDNTVSHAVFRSIDDVTEVLSELKREDLGLSIVVSGLFDQVSKACCNTGLKPLAGIHQFYRGGSFVQLSDPRNERMDQGCQRRNGQQLLLNFFLCPAWETKSEMARAAALKAHLFPGVLPGGLKKRSLRALLSHPYALSVLHASFGSHDRRD